MLARSYFDMCKKISFFKFLCKQNIEYNELCIHLKKEKNDILTSKLIQIIIKFI